MINVISYFVQRLEPDDIIIGYSKVNTYFLLENTKVNVLKLINVLKLTLMFIKRVLVTLIVNSEDVFHATSNSTPAFLYVS